MRWSPPLPESASDAPGWKCKSTIATKEEETINEITTIGLDLAKNVFHLVGCDARGKVVKRKMLKRREVFSYVANLPPCLIGMEACASAHYWGRQLTALGHEVKLIPAQHVKAFLRGNKNDYNDALDRHRGEFEGVTLIRMLMGEPARPVDGRCRRRSG